MGLSTKFKKYIFSQKSDFEKKLSEKVRYHEDYFHQFHLTQKQQKKFKVKKKKEMQLKKQLRNELAHQVCVVEVLISSKTKTFVR